LTGIRGLVTLKTHLSQKISADNGVYVLKTIRTRRFDRSGWVKTNPYPVYRVAETGAIDNFDYYREKELHNLGAYILDVWGNSPVFEDNGEALSYAHSIEEKLLICEYGVSSIETDYIFYGDM
jgi:hypothetical protein